MKAIVNDIDLANIYYHLIKDLVQYGQIIIKTEYGWNGRSIKLIWRNLSGYSEIPMQHRARLSTIGTNGYYVSSW